MTDDGVEAGLDEGPGERRDVVDKWIPVSTRSWFVPSESATT